VSDSDYSMCQQGLRFSPGMNRQDYDRGKADAEDQAALATKTSVSGAGIGLIMMAPILFFMYPIASAIMVAALLGAAKLVHFLPQNHPIMLIGLAVGAMTGNLRDRSLQGVLDNAPPRTLFAGLVALALMVWLDPRFDRLFFPVRDAYAIKQEKKYEGMSDLEIDERKHIDFRARLPSLQSGSPAPSDSAWPSPMRRWRWPPLAGLRHAGSGGRCCSRESSRMGRRRPRPTKKPREQFRGASLNRYGDRRESFRAATRPQATGTWGRWVIASSTFSSGYS
jgi:hypothetical protein